MSCSTAGWLRTVGTTLTSHFLVLGDGQLQVTALTVRNGLIARLHNETSKSESSTAALFLFSQINKRNSRYVTPTQRNRIERCIRQNKKKKANHSTTRRGAEFELKCLDDLILSTSDDQTAADGFRVDLHLDQLAVPGTGGIVVEQVVPLQVSNGFDDRFQILARSGRRQVRFAVRAELSVDVDESDALHVASVLQHRDGRRGAVPGGQVRQVSQMRRQLERQDRQRRQR